MNADTGALFNMIDAPDCTVLLVDDEPAITELVSCVLPSSGMSIFCAHDGFRALEIVKNNTVDVFSQTFVCKQLRKLAITEGLTQLFNRRYIDDWIQYYAITNTGTDVSYSVILIDVAYFKQVNDSFGHDGGDEVLRHLATILSNYGREQDLVGRDGGEEFIVVLPDCDESEALNTAERIRSLVEGTAVRVNTGAVQISVSLGVSTKLHPVMSNESDADKLTQGYVSGRALVAQADKALYAAKDQGRKLCILYLDLSEQLDIKQLSGDKIR